MTFQETHNVALALHLAAVIGDGVAKALHVAPGDRVSLNIITTEGALNSLEFDVVGVIRSYSKEFDQRAIRIPLKEPDADVVFDLQSLFATTYNRSRYEGALRYQGPPPMALPEHVLRWIDEVLRPVRTPPG